MTFFSISVYEDDQPPNSAMSLSAMSTSTPPQVVGNRFFGPDFNIEQIKGTYDFLRYVYENQN